jgi:hypothetical protein
MNCEDAPLHNKSSCIVHNNTYLLLSPIFSTTVCRILVFFDNLQACKELLALQLKTMLDLDIAG